MGQWVIQLLEGEFKKKAQLRVESSSRSDLRELLTCDIVIDFSSPEATSTLTQIAVAHKGRLPVFVIATTGGAKDYPQLLSKLAKRTPVLYASNFSTGICALTEILKVANPLLQKLGYAPLLSETHHQHKKDAPSGTALSLATVLKTKSHKRVEIQSIRAGEVIGDHEISFYGKADRIVLGHYAQDRSLFARGAIECGLWLNSKKVTRTKRVLSMKDFLNGTV
jgi:4-hydroxy-tetrahydrodipicolinate reductase